MTTSGMMSERNDGASIAEVLSPDTSDLLAQNIACVLCYFSFDHDWYRVASGPTGLIVTLCQN